ncbi:MAG: SUMF1/EgtB/PvdO family nonheme iron enzyme, partial [Planctomycetes bacterium]|nr:SUMF1/EgtB/PvdO family nonheme iron enzyme [Planctomycetota bacterium]
MKKKKKTTKKTHATSKSPSPMVVIPDDFADQDQIGYDAHGEGLVEMILRVEATGSFTIGVYGQWGQGKTSMLRQIKRSLDGDDPKVLPEVITVWFNPWRYTAEKHLILPFFHTLVAALEAFVERVEAQEGGLTTFWKKGKRNLLKFWGILKAVPVALAYGLEGEIKVPLFLQAKFNFQPFTDKAFELEKKIDEKLAAKDTVVPPKTVEEYESLYYNLIEALQQAADAFGVKVVVFVDDLDRCLPEKAVELLEGLKVLLDLKNFIFVIGVAREVVEQGIRVRYKELYKQAGPNHASMERDYLEKIIQFPLSLPPAEKDKLRSHVLQLMKNLDRAQPYINTILESVGPTPRNLKRYINAVSFTMWVAERKEQDQDKEKFKDELLIKMSLIAFLLPDLYHQLGKYPHHLLRIQERVSAKPEPDAEKKRKPGDEEDPVQGKTPESHKTGIPEIDQWLERPFREQLEAILAKKTRTLDGEAVKDQGFESKEEVTRYVGLLAAALESKIETETKKPPSPLVKDRSLLEEMKNRLVPIQGDSFKMGDEEVGSYKATVSSFWLDRYPVTQSLFQRVMGKNPSQFQGDDRPVENVSWYDAVEFCNRLSEIIGREPYYKIEGKEVSRIETADGFRLPTEAEWEYACRAGTTTKYWSGDSEKDLDRVGWYYKNSGGETHPVREKPANPWGLFDMHGNVWEWVWDFYDSYPTRSEADYAGHDT